VVAVVGARRAGTGLAPGARSLAARGVRETAATLLGVLTGAAALAWLCLCALRVVAALPRPAARRRALRSAAAGADRLVEWERRRLAAWLRCAVVPRAGLRHRLAYLACRVPMGAAGGYLVAAGLFLTTLLVGGAVWEQLHGTAAAVELRLPGGRLITDTRSLGTGFGLVVLLLTWLLVAAHAAADRWLARRLLGPSTEDLLRDRIDALTASRAGVVRAVDEERRRIERDLHDGVQQRVVALGVLLGRAQRGGDPERAAALVRRAHEEARRAAEELREVAWRVYPAVLDELGLEAALAAVAERSPLPVAIDCDLPRAPAPEVETAVYFAAREAITNAVKHARAREVRVALAERGGALELRVSDDGAGGADPAGGGLTGLARRVDALDGTLAVDSPPGGPTTVTVRIPAGAAADPHPRTPR
jgi:signal transduction histidine kinase